MADPTAAQRKLFAKMGVAMPDGSYYIRNGPQGPGDLQNAIDAVGRGEAAGKSGNVIRKHIMTRAAALKLSSKIPDTWCADGSLKPAEHDAMTLTDFFEHHGVKGMHWGEHKSQVESAASRGLVKTKTIAKKAGKLAVDHPKATVALAVVGTGVYQHREEWKATGVVLARIGKYAYAQYTKPDSPTHETLAIGRQVVQGFVVHSDEELNALAHHGIKGMHWGVRNSSSKAEEGSDKPSKHDRLIEKAANHEAMAKAHKNARNGYEKELAEVQSRGLNSKAGKRVYGDDVASQTPGLFYIKNGQTKGEALDQLTANLRTVKNAHDRRATHHMRVARKLRDKAAKLEHDGLNFDPHFDIDVYLQHIDVYDSFDARLQHHGIKGMHWGVRKSRGPGSEDHERVASIRGKAKVGGGIHVLSNDELQDVNTRLTLETNYARLVNGGGSAIDDGEKFVRSTLNKVKLGVETVETGQKVYKIYNSVKK